ncbi:MAG TPA: aldehyde dehydrogenase family protein [Steroidobacteraceae bacterium]|jgi:betaine-aldehyde dehydrogenase|nr:aldehyde dehydrogenase family protein [Steroidobacteraceae bacterium]
MKLQSDEPVPALRLPQARDLYYGGDWHHSAGGLRVSIENPGTGDMLAHVTHASRGDLDAAVAAAQRGFAHWREVPAGERARVLRQAADVIRRHGAELAMLDAADSGNPYREMRKDADAAAAQVEFFAGLVTEMKGASIPLGPDQVNFSVREPVGVVARLLPFNHPLMFCAGKSAAILAAGNAVIIKPAEQTPLSALRLAELIGPLFPAGVFNVVPADRLAAAHLAAHPGIAKVALVGSVPAGRAVLHAAADTIKPVLLELGGKNALIAFADADPDEVAQAVVEGMNFGWCGQSCGSTSRAFVHASLHDAVLERICNRLPDFVPGLPTDPATRMGALVSRIQYERVLQYIAAAQTDGARLAYGGKRPAQCAPERGYFIEPTVFAEVTAQMRIAREEIFGPVLSVLRWRDPDVMFEQVNALEYGLTCSIWTRDLDTAHRAAQRVAAGFVWVNEVAKHFLGSPFGGYKQSGLGREECLDELLAFTQEKNIHIRLAPAIRDRR